jgi:hypothetical protein
VEYDADPAQVSNVMKHFTGLLLAILLMGSSIGIAAAAPDRAPPDQALPHQALPNQALQERDWKKIRLVINAQLEAFRRDDAIAAYSFAAPEMRSLFRTPGEFMRMVRTGYKAVYRPRSVRFLHHFMVAGQPVQPLEIVTSEDQLIVAYYVMQRQRDGSWKIAGCSLKGAAATSA